MHTRVKYLHGPHKHGPHKQGPHKQGPHRGASEWGAMVRIGVVGGSSLTGAELMRLVARHPDMELAWATGDASSGTAVCDLYPSLAGDRALASMSFRTYHQSMVGDVDLVFLALPHGTSQHVVPALVDSGTRLVDLAADFRLVDAGVYRRWYGEDHVAAGLLGSLAYGLPELNRSEIVASRAVAAAGCYPTAANIAITPLIRAGLASRSGVVVDAASGVSGAGRALKPTSQFSVANENFTAYGLLDHRHTPEMEQQTGAEILFTPHLAPMTRGILATCYLRPTDAADASAVHDCLADAYAGEPFVVVRSEPVSTKSTWGSNSVHLFATADPRTGWIVVLAALDNLVKGASGQAVQCANLLLGLDETAGLDAVGVYP